MSINESMNQEINSIVDEIDERKSLKQSSETEAERRWKKIKAGLLIIAFVFVIAGVYYIKVSKREYVPETDREILRGFGPVGPESSRGGYYFLFNHVLYFAEPSPSNKIFKIENADINTFEFINHDYQRDQSNVYSSGYVVEEADPGTFEPLDRPYAKDKDRVYVHLIKELEEADSETFEVLGGGYQKDKNYVYFHAEIIEEADSETFEVWNDNYAADKNYIYRRDKVMGKRQ